MLELDSSCVTFNGAEQLVAVCEDSSGEDVLSAVCAWEVDPFFVVSMGSLALVVAVDVAVDTNNEVVVRRY